MSNLLLIVGMVALMLIGLYVGHVLGKWYVNRYLRPRWNRQLQDIEDEFAAERRRIADEYIASLDRNRDGGFDC